MDRGSSRKATSNGRPPSGAGRMCVKLAPPRAIAQLNVDEQKARVCCPFTGVHRKTAEQVPEVVH
jgi:hypothetical protein